MVRISDTTCTHFRIPATYFAMKFGRSARKADSGTLIFGEVHPAPMNKASPRSARGSSHGGFRNASREAEVREGRHLRRSNAIDGIECLDVSPTAKRVVGSTVIGAGGAPIPAAPLSCDSRRGLPLVEWVWPSNTSLADVSKMQESVGVSPGDARRSRSSRSHQENPRRHTPVRSAVVIGKVCEPVRPTRLDLGTSEGALEHIYHSSYTT